METSANGYVSANDGDKIGLSKFYFTYGSDPGIAQPFAGGWTVVYATTEEDAKYIHEKVHGRSRDGFYRFCSCYSEENFKLTPMYILGNKGKFTHEILEPPTEEEE